MKYIIVGGLKVLVAIPAIIILILLIPLVAIVEGLDELSGKLDML